MARLSLADQMLALLPPDLAAKVKADAEAIAARQAERQAPARATACRSCKDPLTTEREQKRGTCWDCDEGEAMAHGHYRIPA